MRICIIGDLHIGSIKDINYVYNIMTDIFDKELIFNKTDIIVFNGDYFDASMRINQEHTTLAINIMSYLVKLCKKTHTKIRMIYGTESHEYGQYKLFNYFLNSDEVDLKIINTVTVEDNILYVPEEYVNSKEDHYKKFLYSNNSYDYIFMHGVIVEGMSVVLNDTSIKHNEKKVPYFKSGEFSNISKICIGSHYHMFVDMGDNCYYLGSLFRDSFGEESPKGYGIIEDDKFIFVENESAYIYKSYTFDEDNEIYKSSECLINEINRIKDENKSVFNGDKVGKIRLIFKTPLNLDPSFKENLKSLLYDTKCISTLIKESNELISEVHKSIDTEYEFILDNSLSIIDKVHRYINKQYGYDLTIEEITKYIEDDLKI